MTASCRNVETHEQAESMSVLLFYKGKMAERRDQMVTISATDARKGFFQIANPVYQISAEPVHIKTRTGDVVLINSRSWSALKELLGNR